MREKGNFPYRCEKGEIFLFPREGKRLIYRIKFPYGKFSLWNESLSQKKGAEALPLFRDGQDSENLFHRREGK